MKLSRDPALWLGLFAAVVQLAAAFFFPLTAEQQAVLNACAVAVAGLVVAVWVRRDGQAAAIIGFAQAAIALGLGFGLDIPADGQGAIMAAVSTAAAMFTRTQVTAPVTAIGTRA